MRLDAFPERVLQHAVHRALSDGRRRWRVTNGQYIQVLSPGTLNVHEGPDFANMALLCEGAVMVASGEFHVHGSDWFAHGHGGDPRYRDVALHIVLDNDRPVDNLRWTLVVPMSDVLKCIRAAPQPFVPSANHVDELQQAAIARLKRHIDNARIVIARLGMREALRALTDEWFGRMAMRKHHPVSADIQRQLRQAVAHSPLGQLALTIHERAPESLLEAIRVAELQRIALEGRSLRRELLMNVIFPCCCAVAPNASLVALLQWFWSAPSIHHYAALRRRFPGFDQTYMWQQQGLLEYVRWYSPVYAS
jgi:hypothetical protein